MSRRARKLKALDNSMAKRLPQEIWNHIYTYLVISKLFTLSKTCLWQYYFILYQPVWKEAAEIARLGIPKRKYKTYYDLVQSKANRICDNCYKMGTPYGYRSVLNIRLVIHKNLATVRFCLTCRKNAYVNDRINCHNEQLIAYKFFWNADRTLELVDYREIKSAFNLPWSSIQFSLRKGGAYHVKSILKLARMAYGGDVGIEAFQLARRNRKRSLPRAARSNNSLCLHY